MLVKQFEDETQPYIIESLIVWWTFIEIEGKGEGDWWVLKVKGDFLERWGETKGNQQGHWRVLPNETPFSSSFPCDGYLWEAARTGRDVDGQWFSIRVSGRRGHKCGHFKDQELRQHFFLRQISLIPLQIFLSEVGMEFSWLIHNPFNQNSGNSW